ncbi:MAG: radical SAM protein [Candidatus Riflebacteria bacterium]|nr:radical SAM protein [Candidatus Riflebacteria bacterium]
MIPRRWLTLRQAWNLLRYLCSGWQPILPYRPLYLSVSSVSRCNLRCEFCHVHSPKVSPYPYQHQPCPDVTFSMFRAFLRRFPEALAVSIIGSGEPTLNPDFFRMVEYAHSRNLLTITSTNGTLGPAVMERLADSRLDRLEISLNGYDEDSFHRFTGLDGSLFPRIRRNAERIIARKRVHHRPMDVVLTCVFDRTTYREAGHFVALADELGADRVAIQQFLPIPPVPGFSAAERCLFAADPAVTRFFSETDWARFRVRVELPRLITEKKRFCKSVFTTLRIDGNGQVGGCAGMLLNNAGNGSFLDQEVWNNAYFQRMRGLFLAGRFPEACCRDCVSTSG